ncbi:unnamed protein product [Oncorhynchus mykiss]|uniref:Uncharacterized protein n=1 Tax=Oncorhynchus mykiss TaxID=8022 RepID=A0A060XNJ0_ONCMY|nr:unnamed protein product [Oncorhynchus mykiss]
MGLHKYTRPTLPHSHPLYLHSSIPRLLPTKLTHKPAPLPLTPPTLTPTAPLLTPSPSPPSPTVSAIPSLPPSVTHGKMSFAPGPSFFLTNGNARPPTTPTSPQITPFHTPASRQVPLPRPLGTPTLVQANQSISPVRPRVSQQALLLGRSPCSSRDQMLLRAQMVTTHTPTTLSPTSTHFKLLKLNLETGLFQASSVQHSYLSLSFTLSFLCLYSVCLSVSLSFLADFHLYGTACLFLFLSPCLRSGEQFSRCVLGV